MTKNWVKTCVLLCSISFAGSSLAAPKMNLSKPDLPEDDAPTYSADLKDGLRYDDGRMNAQLLTEEFEAGEAYIDAELLSDLDLDEIGLYDNPLDDTLMSDR